MKNIDDFIPTAKKLVSRYANSKLEDELDVIQPEDVYVVWSAKTLQNYKALLSTNISDGRYYEVTLNGDKQEIYFDAYKKEHNSAIDVKGGE